MPGNPKEDSPKGAKKSAKKVILESIGFGKKKTNLLSHADSPAGSNTNLIQETVKISHSISHSRSVDNVLMAAESKTGSYSSLNNILAGEIDLAELVTEDFLQKVNEQGGSIAQNHFSSGNLNNDNDDLVEEIFVSDYTKEWMRQEELADRKLAQEKVLSSTSLQMGSASAEGMFASKASAGVWSAPDSWVVISDSQFVVEKRTNKDDPISCIRVFKREGTFATVSCPITISSRDLCLLLAKKFFIQPDNAPKYQLWLVRNVLDPETMGIIHLETLMDPLMKPLQIQQRLLCQMGYDPDNDKFKEILREDNSYLYRWTFGESGTYSQTYSAVSSQLASNPLTSRMNFLTDYEKKIFDILKLPADDKGDLDIDIRGLNLNAIPNQVLNKAESIRSLKVGSNLNLEIPKEFVDLCYSLCFVSLSGLHLPKFPNALSSIKTLEHLDLSNNLISTLRRSNLSLLVNLKMLLLNNNRLLSKNSIPIEDVSGMAKLEVFNLSCNWLRGECPPSLMYIGSSFTKIPDELVSLKSFKNPLQQLDLSYNLITSIPSDFGVNLPNLKVLRLVSNSLSRIPPFFATSFTNMEVFDIRGNHIRGAAGIFLGTTVVSAPTSSVEGLNVIPSPLQSPHTDIRFPPSKDAETDVRKFKLTKLLLDNNQISDLRFDQKLEHTATIVSHRNPGLLQVAFTALLPALTTLILSSSRLAFLPDDSFSYTPALKVLVLNHNQISTLPTSITTLKNLLRLELAHNSIAKLPASIKDWRSLEIIDLRGNNLKEIPPEIWELKIKFMNLSSNVIESWPDNPYLLTNSGETSARVSGGSNVTNSLYRPSVYGSSGMPQILESGLAGITSTTDLTKNDAESFDRMVVNGLLSPLSNSLEWISLSDNRIDGHFFENGVTYMPSLRTLNVSHNDIFSIPPGTMRSCAGVIRELYLSGNHLTQLPDDFQQFKNLRRLYLNNNRLGTIPPELGRISNLRVIDAGRNQLRYNVANWPYDWNWNFNTELRYLNLSGNPKLEIKGAVVNQSSSPSKKNKEGDGQDKPDLSKFDGLTKLRTLGLMDVGLSTAVPDESKSLRVRVSALGGASAHWRKQIGADNVAPGESGKADPSASTSTLTEFPSLNVSPLVPYGISDNLGLKERSTCRDVVILGGKFFQNAKDDARTATDNGDTTLITRALRKNKAGECVFGLFDGGINGGNMCGKLLTDSFVARFSTELKKVVKERQSKRLKSTGGVDSEPELSDSFARQTDSSLIENALRRTFILINKKLGDLAWQSEHPNAAPVKGNEEDLLTRKEKPKVTELQPPDSEKKRKYSVNFETNIQGKLKKSARKSAASAAIEEKTKTKLESETTTAQKESTAQPKSESTSYWNDSDSDYSDDEETPEEAYLRLQQFGHSGLIAYVVNSQLFVANCGDVMAVISRNGIAVPVSTKHTLFSFQASASRPIMQNSEDNSASVDSTKELPLKSGRKDSEDKISKNQEKQSVAAKVDIQSANRAKSELHRIRETGGYVTNDGLVCNKTVLCRAFGFFSLLPHINASPAISVTDLTDQDEFLIIATGSFWNTIHFQTAVDVARLKSDDALEAAMILRDFAVAYGGGASFVIDNDSVFQEERYRVKMKQSDAESGRYINQNAMTVMVISLRELTGSRQKKAFTKIKRRRDETVDSEIARLAPEIEPPTGFVTLVFTDVRNSTALWEKMPLAMRVAIRDHNQIMRRNLRNCNGYEVKTEGDAFMVAFKDVLDALRWCISIQLQLLNADWPQEILESIDGQDVYGPKNLVDRNGETLLYRGLSIRMGMHCGHPVAELDPITRRMDYFGPMVNKTSRVCGAAEGGQILISQDVEKTYRKLRMSTARDDGKRTINTSEKLSSLNFLDPVFIGVGEKKLKGFENPEPLISVLPRDLVSRHRVPPPNLIPGLDSTQSEISIDYPPVNEILFDGSQSDSQLQLNVDYDAQKTRQSSLAIDVTEADINRLRPSADTFERNNSGVNSALQLPVISESEDFLNTTSTSSSLESSIYLRQGRRNVSVDIQESNQEELQLIKICCRIGNIVRGVVQDLITDLQRVDGYKQRIVLMSNFDHFPQIIRMGKYVERLERLTSSLHVIWASSVVADIRTKSAQEQRDFVNMLLMLTEMTIE